MERKCDELRKYHAIEKKNGCRSRVGEHPFSSDVAALPTASVVYMFPPALNAFISDVNSLDFVVANQGGPPLLPCTGKCSIDVTKRRGTKTKGKKKEFQGRYT